MLRHIASLSGISSDQVQSVEVSQEKEFIQPEMTDEIVGIQKRLQLDEEVTTEEAIQYILFRIGALVKNGDTVLTKYQDYERVKKLVGENGENKWIAQALDEYESPALKHVKVDDKRPDYEQEK